MRFHRILVPLDGSSFGEHALPLASSLARRAEIPLELVHVYQPIGSPDADPSAKDANEAGKRKARAYLDEAAERVRPLAGTGVETTLLEGPVAQRVLERGAEASVDLIVMTTHGRGPLSRSWLGSVADELVRHSVTPLLLIRPREETVDLTAEPAMRRILVPLDGSRFAEQALEPAVALGTLMQAEYRLLRVVTPAVGGGTDPWFAPVHAPEMDLHGQARAYLKEAWERLQQSQPGSVRAHVATAFNPAGAILEDAEQAQADLIALATHGRGGIPRLVLGSVADKVVRAANVPVLVHRPAAAT